MEEQSLIQQYSTQSTLGGVFLHQATIGSETILDATTSGGCDGEFLHHPLKQTFIDGLAAEKINRSNQLLNLKVLEFENETGPLLSQQKEEKEIKQHNLNLLESKTRRSVCVGIMPKSKHLEARKLST